MTGSGGDYRWRRARVGDVGFLLEMLMEAVNWATDRDVSRAEVEQTPDLMRYVDGWMRPGDLGIVATDDEMPIGAAWIRTFDPHEPGYGFVAEGVPELSMAVVPKRRVRGVGSALLAEIIRVARAEGVEAMSLSVERANPAQRLYARAGFRVVAEGPASDTMTLVLHDARE